MVLKERLVAFGSCRRNTSGDGSVNGLHTAHRQTPSDTGCFSADGEPGQALWSDRRHGVDRRGIAGAGTRTVVQQTARCGQTGYWGSRDTDCGPTDGTVWTDGVLREPGHRLWSDRRHGVDRRGIGGGGGDTDYGPTDGTVWTDGVLGEPGHGLWCDRRHGVDRRGIGGVGTPTVVRQTAPCGQTGYWWSRDTDCGPIDGTVYWTDGVLGEPGRGLWSDRRHGVDRRGIGGAGTGTVVRQTARCGQTGYWGSRDRDCGPTDGTVWTDGVLGEPGHGLWSDRRHGVDRRGIGGAGTGTVVRQTARCGQTGYWGSRDTDCGPTDGTVWTDGVLGEPGQGLWSDRRHGVDRRGVGGVGTLLWSDRQYGVDRRGIGGAGTGTVVRQTARCGQTGYLGSRDTDCGPTDNTVWTDGVLGGHGLWSDRRGMGGGDTDYGPTDGTVWTDGEFGEPGQGLWSDRRHGVDRQGIGGAGTRTVVRQTPRCGQTGYLGSRDTDCGPTDNTVWTDGVLGGDTDYGPTDGTVWTDGVLGEPGHGLWCDRRHGVDRRGIAGAGTQTVVRQTARCGQTGYWGSRDTTVVRETAR